MRATCFKYTLLPLVFGPTYYIYAMGGYIYIMCVSYYIYARGGYIYNVCVCDRYVYICDMCMCYR